MEINIDSPARIRELLEARGLSLKKRFGQNFLIDPAARSRIIETAGIERDDTVWEIGPGIGSLTGAVLDRCDRLTAFEIDRGFCRLLRERFTGRREFRLVEGDFLKVWRAEARRRGRPVVVFGNLPYGTASVIVSDLIVGDVRPKRMVFTVQREVAERMTALPDSPRFSAFSYLCRLSFDVVFRGDLPPGAFYPEPHVFSRVVEMNSHSRYQGIDPVFFALILKTLFRTKRKTVKNSLARPGGGLGLDADGWLTALDEADIPHDSRIEAIPLDRLAALTEIARSRAVPEERP